MDAAIIELDTLPFDALDETLRLEVFQIVAGSLLHVLSGQPGKQARVRCFPERRAEVLDDEDPARTLAICTTNRVNFVVRRLPVPVIQQHVGDDEALERLRSDEVVLIPVPVAFELPVRQPWTEARRLLRA